MQPSLGVITTMQSPVSYSIFANNEVHETSPAMLRAYDNNDFRFVVGTAGSLFPLGALLGWNAFAGPTAAAAMAADGVPAAGTLQLFTYTTVALPARGRLSLNIIPVSIAQHACVLAKDVDLNDASMPTMDYIVPVYFRGTFKKNGVIQDAESFAAAPFISTDRITIQPVNR